MPALALQPERVCQHIAVHEDTLQAPTAAAAAAAASAARAAFPAPGNKCLQHGTHSNGHLRLCDRSPCAEFGRIVGSSAWRKRSMSWPLTIPDISRIRTVCNQALVDAGALAGSAQLKSQWLGALGRAKSLKSYAGRSSTVLILPSSKVA